MGRQKQRHSNVYRSRSLHSQQLNSPLMLNPTLEDSIEPRAVSASPSRRAVRSTASSHMEPMSLSHAFAPTEQRKIFCGKPNYGYSSNFVSSTKYSPMTFVPRNLIEQFSRMANFYFLFMTIMECIPQISPVDPFTSVTPLVFVLSVTAVKDAYEDIQRARQDRITNDRKVFVRRAQATPPDSPPLDSPSPKDWIEVRWRDVRVGDAVRVENNSPIPCDLLLVTTSEDHGTCFIESSNLDGETNLKVYQAPPPVHAAHERVRSYSSSSASSFDQDETERWKGLDVLGIINCELPNNRLYKFNGNCRLPGGETVPLDYRHLLLRGQSLRNTPWVIGVAVYTGKDTKLMQNMSLKRPKQSRLEHAMNKYIVYMIIVQVSLSLLAALLHGQWTGSWGGEHWYVFSDNPAWELAVFDFWTFMILLATLIPISLYVSVEVVRVAQAAFLGWDVGMYSPEYGVNCQARTTSLNEELGQVQYVFSDKTGTLTRNKMDFVKCAIGGTVYGNYEPGERNGEACFSDDEFDRLLCKPSEGGDDMGRSRGLHDFLLTCALCHTVVRTQDPITNRHRYEGASPDEIALVKFAESRGYRFLDRDPKTVTIEVNATALKDEDRAKVGGLDCSGDGDRGARGTSLDQDQAGSGDGDGKGGEVGSNAAVRRRTFRLLNVIEFNSDRKRMSVIVQETDKTEGRDSVLVLCKGADNVILPRLARSQKDDNGSDANAGSGIGDVEHRLEQFSKTGLRTLCLASRSLTAEEYQDWAAKWKDAEVSLRGRDEKLARVAALVERDLSMVGVSAIEDQLQQGVPATIKTLVEANINVWMLTGDKTETAIQIAQTCSLLDGETPLVMLTSNSVANKAAAEQALMRALASISGDVDRTQLVIDGRTLEWCLTDFSDLLLRIVPTARAVVVCRASPLQKAQTVNLVKDGMGKVTLAIGDGANDVPMIQAAHLGVGIEGEEGCQAVVNSDFSIGQFRHLRNLVVVHGRLLYARISLLFLYSFYKNFLFALAHMWLGMHSMFSGQSFYNSLLVSTFNMFFTAFPILVLAVFDKDISHETALRHPSLYIETQKSQGFNARVFWIWVLLGSVQSLPCFYLPLVAFQDQGLWAVSFVSSTCVIIVSNIKIVLSCSTLNWFHFHALAFSIYSFFLLTWLYELYQREYYPGSTLDGVMFHILPQPLFYAAVILTSAVCVLPDYALLAWTHLFSPSAAAVLRERECSPQTT